MKYTAVQKKRIRAQERRVLRAVKLMVDSDSEFKAAEALYSLCKQQQLLEQIRKGKAIWIDQL